METLIRYLPNLDLVNENHHGHVILMSGSRPYRNAKDTSSDYPSAKPLPTCRVCDRSQLPQTIDVKKRFLRFNVFIITNR